MVEYGERDKGEAAAFGIKLEKAGSLLCFFTETSMRSFLGVHNCALAKSCDNENTRFSQCVEKRMLLFTWDQRTRLRENFLLQKKTGIKRCIVKYCFSILS